MESLLYTWLIRESVHFNMAIYSNENITEIVKLSPHEFPNLLKNPEIYAVYSSSCFKFMNTSFSLFLLLYLFIYFIYLDIYLCTFMFFIYLFDK